ncbi:MAG: hypothetical protein LBT46_02755, partial [Planctomycetaceae bacterium]|nr:hypothetical protein [Planctomycetaceae bacterium]
MNYLKNAVSIMVLLFAGLTMQSSADQSTITVNQNSLESGFTSPPETVRTGCYWYWTDDNITEEGIVADLQAMKKAGITRAFVGLIGVKKIGFMSDQWWKLVHVALKTATELDIEIGMFNCPGWSQSGGPWVKPTQAMRYL